MGTHKRFQQLRPLISIEIGSSTGDYIYMPAPGGRGGLSKGMKATSWLFRRRRLSTIATVMSILNSLIQLRAIASFRYSLISKKMGILRAESARFGSYWKPDSDGQRTLEGAYWLPLLGMMFGKLASGRLES